MLSVGGEVQRAKVVTWQRLDVVVVASWQLANGVKSLESL